MSSIYSYNFKQELEEEILKELKIFMEYIDMKNGKLHPANLPGEDYDLFDEPDYAEVYSPAHYTQGEIECIDAITAATVNKKGIEAVCVANIIKYLWRYEKKGGKKDVEKAEWYLEKLLENL